MEALISLFVYLLLLYLLIGFVFAIFFMLKGIGRIDELAKETSWGFRFLMIPGSMALWPVLLAKWIKASRL